MKRYLFGITLLAFLGCAPSATSGPNPAATTTPGVVAQVTPSPAPAAPTPTATDQNGATVDFSSLYQKGPVLVYFYPKADTPGCTDQACSLRDSYQKLTDAGLTVVGVSTDDQAAQKAFQEKHQLPFTLVADPNKVVLEAFGVSSMAGLANREAFLIRDGKVVWHDDSASTAKQADDVLAQMAAWK